MPERPVTRGNTPILERDEKKIPLDKLHEEAVANMETIHVDDL